MFWRRKRPPADFSEEIRSHLQIEADEWKSDGLADPEPGATMRFPVQFIPRHIA
jgi:hypothetical protein